MLLRRCLLLTTLCSLLAIGLGCGGHQPGVVEGPDEPAPELTPEEEEREEEYIRSLRN